MRSGGVKFKIVLMLMIIKLIKKHMKIENMKNYTDYNDWLDSNYLSSDYTDEEIDDLYEMCTKNKSFEIDEWKLINEHCNMV